MYFQVFVELKWKVPRVERGAFGGNYFCILRAPLASRLVLKSKKRVLVYKPRQVRGERRFTPRGRPPSVVISNQLMRSRESSSRAGLGRKVERPRGDRQLLVFPFMWN